MLLSRVFAVSVVILAIALPVYAFFPIIFEVGGIVLAGLYVVIANQIRQEFALNRAAQTIARGKDYSRQFAVRGGTLYIWWQQWGMGDSTFSEADVMSAVTEVINHLNPKSRSHGFSNLATNAKCPPAGGLGWEYIPSNGANNGLGHKPKPLWTINNTDAVMPYEIVNKTSIETPLPRPPVNGNPLCKREDVYRPLYKCSSPSTLLGGTKVSEGFSLWSPMNIRMYVEKGGNLCLYYYDPSPKNYWCMNWPAPTGDYYWIFKDIGCLCRFDGTDKGYCTPCQNGQFRLTIQNDGNLVAYNGAGLDKPIWSSNTPIFKNKVSTPCW
jgi:hypothetical protein